MPAEVDWALLLLEKYVRRLLQVPLDGDDCLRLESHICLHSVNSVYYLYGKVPDMYIFNETADISQFCDLVWYDWIISPMNC